MAYGAYLAGLAGHCIVCHSAAGPNGAPDIVNQLGAGSFQFPGPGGISVSANIGSDPDYGIGAVSGELVGRAIREGINRDGQPMAPPMPYGYYRNIGDADMAAIIAYLRSSPPIGQQ